LKFFHHVFGRGFPGADMSEHDAKSKAAVWGRIRQTLSDFMHSGCGGAAKRLFALLILCMLALNGLNVVNSYVGRDFISSVESRDMPRFMWVSLVYVLVLGVCTVVAVFFRFVEERLALLWREWQTRRFLERYLANRAYLRLAANGSMENPDQRIAEDVRAFATSSLSIFLMTLNAVFTVIAFSGVMWSISPLLFAGAVAYGLLGTLVTVFLGRRLVGLNSRQADKEAVFRSELLQVRENAEVLAMQRREHQVSERLMEGFAEVVANARRMIAVNRNVSFFTTGYNYLIPVIPVFVVAHLFMWGQVEFGVITQSSLAFAQLMGAFSLIITQFQSMSAYAAVLARIRVFGDALNASSAERNGLLKLVEENGRLAFDELTLMAPDGHPFVSKLSLVVSSGRSLLIRAEDHRATRALFRATAGLPQHGEGRISRPDEAHFVFLPERPHLPNGTLREWMSATADSSAVATSQIVDALSAVGLATLPERYAGLDTWQEWSEALSPEEQSMLAAAHALIALPDFVLFDNIGSVLEPVKLKRVLGALSDHGIGYICLGRPSHEEGPFDCVVHISQDGTWEMIQFQD
jgi:putative ATP-binding cassette transporter